MVTLLVAKGCVPQEITYSRILFNKILAISTRRLWKHSSQNFHEKNSFSWPDLNPSPFLKTVLL